MAYVNGCGMCAPRRRASGFAHRAAHEVRASPQPQDGSGARDHVSPDAPHLGGRGDPIGMRGTPESGTQDTGAWPNKS
jgi:hypothetical protein